MIALRNVSKSFERGGSRVLLSQLLRPGRKMTTGFQAVTDISFELAGGHSLALIGPNGAGKSTLLSMIAGIYQPDAGTVTVQGRIAALLELGAGFHPDLTGRENLILSGALLGLTQQEIERKMPAIIEFSGVGEFIDQSLRTFSTGMAMRLAFAVAVHVDPDVLLIDEVFAVGDQHFQEQCQTSIRKFRSAGKTMVCVSHDTELLSELCDVGLWIERGRQIQYGPVNDVIAAYEATADGQ